MFTNAEMQLIREQYPNTLTQTIADALGVPVQSVYGFANRSGIKKSKEYLEQETRRVGMALVNNEKAKATRFVKGQAAWNKGKKGVCWSPDSVFKKGNLPHNTRNDGDIAVRYDKNGKPYQFIRISLAVWEPLHVHEYKKHVGPIPKGHVVCFRDGNTLNCEVSNLEMMTKADNMRRNSIMRYPHDVRRAIHALGTLKRTINSQTKQE